ncbi:carbohydrate-binding module family 48 protein [Tilletiaria anomala UBC 951]|uniref:Carbohydrate-binding module family 48 protein n=1 Tax=Tilletiaria anomala (strain ATCC 24038 / CBS 436.72 / UBC 951) TaxID=1037660 RepID=A0A066V5X9_TILAU|nr:carbohydrate-binding module family 48 protein [Tilletiaria anomala UBC 951]KDN37157.1 carbohydrate-binding module family 48 protein [Tilletiaria anomala UBC 951]
MQRRHYVQHRNANALPPATVNNAGTHSSSLQMHLPIPSAGAAPGFPTSRYASPLSSPVVGTDSMHAQGMVVSGSDANSRSSIISSSSGATAGGSNTATSAVAAVAAAAAGKSPSAKNTHADTRHGALFSTDVGDLSAFGEDDSGSQGTSTISRLEGMPLESSTSRQRAGSFDSMVGSGLLSPSQHRHAHAGPGATLTAGKGATDPLGRSISTALPSYLKIPTAIPSENVPAPTADEIANWHSSPPTSSALGPVLRVDFANGACALGGGALMGPVPIAGFSVDGKPSTSATVAILPHMISYAAFYRTPSVPTVQDSNTFPITNTANIPTMLANDNTGQFFPDTGPAFFLDQPLVSSTVGPISAQQLGRVNAEVQSASLAQPVAERLDAEDTKVEASGAAHGEKEREGSRTPTPASGAIGSGPRSLTPGDSQNAHVMSMTSTAKQEGHNMLSADVNSQVTSIPTSGALQTPPGPKVLEVVADLVSAASTPAHAEGSTAIATVPLAAGTVVAAPAPVYGFMAQDLHAAVINAEPEGDYQHQDALAGHDPQTPTRFERSGSSSKGSAATLKGLAPGMTPATAASGPSSSPASTPAKERFPHGRQQQAQDGQAQGHQHHHHHHHGPMHGPLMPIVITWRAGGKEVFVTGTFANEWRSKIPLRRSKRDHTCILHLPPGTHRLKFIVDDRWRVSKDLPTASDGDGNLVNYVEIPNVGPAHPGPLSAPGEEMLGDAMSATDRGDAAGAGAGISSATGRMAVSTHRGKTALDSHRSTIDLQEEARRAEILRRGDLDDVFADFDVSHKQEAWTREIPESLVAAQEAEEAAQQRGSEDGRPEEASAKNAGDADGLPRLPIPPTLPRQLEKVILNSSPATNALQAGGTVDDNSVLPAPNHVVLNHLTASAIKSGVLAVGTTTRYKRKYVTTVFYRPVKA